MLALLPDREAGRHEIGVVERAERDRDEPLELAVDHIMDVRPALGAEMKGGAVAAVAGQRTSCSTCPRSCTCSAGQRAWAAKALPDRFLQSRQWHTDTRTGSPVDRGA